MWFLLHYNLVTFDSIIDDCLGVCICLLLIGDMHGILYQCKLVDWCVWEQTCVHFFSPAVWSICYMGQVPHSLAVQGSCPYYVHNALWTFIGVCWPGCAGRTIFCETRGLFSLLVIYQNKNKSLQEITKETTKGKIITKYLSMNIYRLPDGISSLIHVTARFHGGKLAHNPVYLAAPSWRHPNANVLCHTWP